VKQLLALQPVGADCARALFQDQPIGEAAGVVELVFPVLFRVELDDFRSG